MNPEAPQLVRQLADQQPDQASQLVTQNAQPVTQATWWRSY